MVNEMQTYTSFSSEPEKGNPPQDGCLLVIFGASGDLTKRLLMPSLYNLACDGLLPKNFAIVGVGRSKWTTEFFRERMTEDIKKFSTRPQFDEKVWNEFSHLLHYSAVSFDDLETYHELGRFLESLGSQLKT